MAKPALPNSVALNVMHILLVHRYGLFIPNKGGITIWMAWRQFCLVGGLTRFARFSFSVSPPPPPRHARTHERPNIVGRTARCRSVGGTYEHGRALVPRTDADGRMDERASERAIGGA